MTCTKIITKDTRKLRKGGSPIKRNWSLPHRFAHLCTPTVPEITIKASRL